MKKNKYAFTLVELIVVLTIIAILWTIAFITMQWYSASSRDSVRISDMSKISSSLELFNIDAWKYPDPTEAQPVTYSWWLAWYQWIFWNATFTNVSRLDKVPVDPLTQKEYAYSVLNTKQEFEIWSILEWDELGLNTVNQTNASEKIAYWKITWTYNWVWLRVNTPSTSYILAVPSILTSIDLWVETNRALEVIIPANELVLDNYRNLPSNYVWTSYDSNKETSNPDFKLVNNILVYEWDVKNLTPTILITKLQESYSWTTVALTDATAELFKINVTSGLELEKIDNYWINFINNNLWWSAVSRIYNTCDGVAHNTLKTYYSAPSVLFWVSCDTIKKDFICIDWTWTDTPTWANILDYPETECIVEEPLNCTYLETPINHWDSITVYSQDILAWDATETCDDMIWTVTCNNEVNEWDTTFAYMTCTKWAATNCTADPSYDLNGHIYNVIQMDHNVTSTPTVDVSENNGTFRYTMNALCNDWIITWNETWPVIQSCNTNYTISWNTCVPSVCKFDSWVFDLCVFWS